MSSIVSNSPNKRVTSSVGKLFLDTCNVVQMYIKNIQHPKLVLGATPCDMEINDRFPGNEFVFLDIKDDQFLENLIICDLNNIKELEYLSKTFRKTFQKIIFDTAVLKFVDWSVVHLQLIKKMLVLNGEFIMPAPNCKTGNISYITGVPRIINKKIDYPDFYQQWDPTEIEYFEIVNKLYDEIPLTLSPPCFIPDSWRKKYVLNTQKLNNITNKLYNLILYYNDFLLKIVFKNVQLIDYKHSKSINSVLGFKFVQNTPIFICL